MSDEKKNYEKSQASRNTPIKKNYSQIQYSILYKGYKNTLKRLRQSKLYKREDYLKNRFIYLFFFLLFFLFEYWEFNE